MENYYITIVLHLSLDLTVLIKHLLKHRKEYVKKALLKKSNKKMVVLKQRPSK